MRRVHGGVAAVLVLLAGAEVRAHGLAAAFVSIETSDGYQADVLVKLPRLEGATPGLSVRFAEGCEELSSAMRLQRTDGVVERWSIRCTKPLAGMKIELLGLSTVLGEAFVEFRSLDAPEWNTILRRGTATTRLGARERAGFENNASYFPLGVEHILSGFDHVFFVIGLLLIVWRTRAPEGGRSVANTILATITAFTIGHSVTLAAATLGLLKLPAAPTELAIALSVLLLAVELARDDRSTLTMRFPWLIAFVFGLLHGFGFAGALAEIGLPPDGIAMPLLLFNLGVEAGQLLIVLVAGSAMLVARSVSGRTRASSGANPAFNRLLIYGIGTVTAYWCFERSLGWFLG
jgi:hypothetical protein